MSILKVNVTIVPLFVLIFYSLVPKIEICLIHFLDKIFKSSHSDWGHGISKTYVPDTYSRVHISSDTAFLKILKKPSIVQE